MKKCFMMMVVVLAGITALAQMPQDNWRYDNLSFSGPDTNVNKRCIGVGGGMVYVSQEETPQTVVQFQTDGTFVRKFGAFGYVLGIGVDQAGNAYVLDRTGCKLRVYNSGGTLLREWGGEGSANGLFKFKNQSNSNIAGSGFVAVGYDDQVYICDPGNARIQVFNSSGTWLRNIGELGVLPGQFAQNNPLNVGVAANGNLYAFSDSTTPPAVQIFDAQGIYLRGVNLSRVQVHSFSVAADGVFYGRYYYNSSWDFLYDSEFTHIRSYESLLVSQATGSSIYTAFDSRGDLYMVYNKTVYVCEREYSGVHNRLVPTALPQPTVTATAQRPGTSWLDVDYRVDDVDSPTVQAAALAFINSGNDFNTAVPIRTLVDGTEGCLGPDQPTGLNRRFTWNMAADWSVDFARIQVEVLAKDERAPLGIHWIRIPASEDGPQVEVSRKPVDEGELRNLWYWLLASGDAGIEQRGGQLYGTGGIFANQLLASSESWSDGGVQRTTRTAALGREYLYRYLGIRAARPDEIARANAGRYGFVSVNGDSVVGEPRSGNERWLRGWGYDSSYRVSGIGTAVLSPYHGTVAAGDSHSFALSESGSLIGWGGNYDGQLGDGTNTDRSAPVEVASGVTAVAAGYRHSLFVKSDGTLWAMGHNNNGQLGDGTTSNRSTPVQVASGVTAVAAGYYHSLFIKSNGTLWGYGL